MSFTDKAKATADEAGAEAKEAVGGPTDQDDMKPEDQRDQIQSDVEKAGEHLEGKPRVN